MRSVVVLAVIVLLGAIPVACGGSDAAPTSTPAATVAASHTLQATATQPSSAAGGGQLAFAGTPEGAPASGIYLVNSDGSGLRAIWTWETDGSQAVYLVWSPDGRQLAFFGHDAGTRSSGLYVLDVDAGDLTRLVEVGILWYPPVWSPDGSQLYFSGSSALAPNAIGVVPADGSAPPTLLVPEPERGTPMTISPNGQQIAASVGGPPKLGVMSVDDQQLQVLPDDVNLSGAPVWSPDSQQIAFIGHVPDDSSGQIYLGPGQLHVVNADGTGLTQLSAVEPPGVVQSGYAAADPVWSPDGQEIAYTVNLENAMQVYVSSVDGSQTRNLSENPGVSGTGLSWSPDGQEIALVSERDIRVSTADGANARNVVAGVQFGNFMELIGLPEWRPVVP